MDACTRSDGVLYAACFRLSRTLHAVLEPVLEEAQLGLAVWEAEDLDAVVYRGYRESRGEAEALLETLRGILTECLPGEAVELLIEEVPREDWSESWKIHFRAHRVSVRVVIHPSWERPVLRPGDIGIELDPGLSFGTGLHPTTRACVAMMDRLSAERPGASFLDLGCGSGILAITAARLGLTRVTAVDYDPVAVAIARENAVRNGVAERIRCVEGDVLGGGLNAGAFDMVAANLLADLLVEALPEVVLCVAPGGHLMLSGILTEQYAGVRAAYEAAGFMHCECLTEAEWTSGLMRLL